MNTRLSANLSVLGTSLMLILSFSFGFHSYTEAKKTIVTDLNQALQQTILLNDRMSWKCHGNVSYLSGDYLRCCCLLPLLLPENKSNKIRI